MKEQLRILENRTWALIGKGTLSGYWYRGGRRGGLRVSSLSISLFEGKVEGEEREERKIEEKAFLCFYPPPLSPPLE